VAVVAGRPYYGSIIGFVSRTRVTNIFSMAVRALGFRVETKCPS